MKNKMKLSTSQKRVRVTKEKAQDCRRERKVWTTSGRRYSTLTKTYSLAGSSEVQCIKESAGTRREKIRRQEKKETSYGQGKAAGVGER